MDFKDLIKQIAERVEKLKDNLPTEEATKNALILPFIQMLGYDVFNPLEVLPEMTCDLGMKKGEKIDYAIMNAGEPIMLIECKHWSQNLDLHDNQLIRYFHASKAKFGVLTNGIIYRFYTDLATPNKMDEKPFLEVNMIDLKDNQIEELKKFHKSYFDVETILNSASELKYTSELKNLFVKEFTAPAPDFVKYFARQIYDGMITAKVLEMFTELTKKSLHGYITDKITERLKSAIEKQEKPNAAELKEPAPSIKQLPEGVVAMSEDGSIVTTQEEIDAYNIVRSILRKDFDVSRITYNDYKSYFVVNIDNSSKWICRFYLSKYKYISFPGVEKEEKIEIKSLDEIFNHTDRLQESLKKYL